MGPGSRSPCSLARDDVDRFITRADFDFFENVRHKSAIPRRDAPELCMILRLPKTRAQGKPGARCTRSLVCKVLVAHERRHYRSTGFTRPSLRNGFNGLLRALPGDRAFLPPSSTDNSANLTPASGRQDHTTSPSASASFVRALLRAWCCRVHCIPCPTSVTIAIRPSFGTGWQGL